jgi:hypothetical protein
MGCLSTRLEYTPEEEIINKAEIDLLYSEHSVDTIYTVHLANSTQGGVNDYQWSRIARTLKLGVASQKASVPITLFYEDFKVENKYDIKQLIVLGIILSKGSEKQKSEYLFELYGSLNTQTIKTEVISSVISLILNIAAEKIPKLIKRSELSDEAKKKLDKYLGEILETREFSRNEIIKSITKESSLINKHDFVSWFEKSRHHGLWLNSAGIRYNLRKNVKYYMKKANNIEKKDPGFSRVKFKIDEHGNEVLEKNPDTEDKEVENPSEVLKPEESTNDSRKVDNEEAKDDKKIDSAKHIEQEEYKKLEEIKKKEEEHKKLEEIKKKEEEHKKLEEIKKKEEEHKKLEEIKKKEEEHKKLEEIKKKEEEDKILEEINKKEEHKKINEHEEKKKQKKKKKHPHHIVEDLKEEKDKLVYDTNELKNETIKKSDKEEETRHSEDHKDGNEETDKKLNEAHLNVHAPGLDIKLEGDNP